MSLNEEQLTWALKTNTLETIEELAFISLLPLSSGERPQQPGPMARAEIQVMKPFVGRICLEVSPEVLEEIQETLFVEPDEEQDAETVNQDILFEVLNTIAGKTIREVVDLGDGFEIGLPYTGTSAGQFADCRLTQWFEADGRFLAVAFCRDKECELG